MIDSNNVITNYNKTKTPLKNICIHSITEDEEGNVYFVLYNYDSGGAINSIKEGFAIYSKDGNLKVYNDENSGLPGNVLNSLLYDKFEKVLWISTNESGLVRFDLKDGWENYHNNNSNLPCSSIFDLSQDSKGNIFVSTFNGMVRIKKK